MKIKHWQGYGFVDATKVSEKDLSLTDEKYIVIRVKGNHEWGIERNDTYDVSRWLLPRFVKGFKDGTYDYRNIVSMSLHPNIEKDDNGESVDICDYIIVYSTK